MLLSLLMVRPGQAKLILWRATNMKKLKLMSAQAKL